MSRRRSITVDVDGQPVRLCGVQGEMTPEAQEAIAELVRAAKEAVELQPRCLAREQDRVLPCLRPPGHEPPHRTGGGREWT